MKGAFKQAYDIRRPRPGLIFHTDQGGNYQARTFCAYLEERQVVQSFSRAGSPYDNAVMESFFSAMKREELYRHKYRSEKEFRAGIEDYTQFYNCKRVHKTLQYKTPEQAEQTYIETAMKSGDRKLD